MDDKDTNSREKVVSDSIEDQFDELFAPGKPAEETDIEKKSPVSDSPHVKEIQQEKPDEKPLDKKEISAKTSPADKEQVSSKPSSGKAGQKFTPNKTLIKKVSPSAQAGRRKPAVKETAPPEVKELPPEDTGKPPVQNVFKKANEEYKKNIFLETARQCLNPFLFTLLVLLLVILSMFIGKVIIPDEMMEFVSSKKTPASVQKPSPAGHTNKRKISVSKDEKTSSVKVVINESKIEKPVSPDREKTKKGEQPADAEAELTVKSVENPPSAINYKKLSYPYSIYLGSYGSITKVKNAASDFSEKEIATYWTKLDLGEKGIWFRLFTGCFQNREDADLFIRKHELKEAESRLTKFTNLIGVYKTKEDTDNQKEQLEKLGYSTYIISDAKDAHRLYIGAFYQKSRAEEQKRDLERNGIQSELVER